MKRTLLDMTQSILSALDSDEINSISDNSEALQVAEIIKNTYYNIVSRSDLPNLNKIFKLNPSNDATKPVLMSVPDGSTYIEYIQYYDADTDANLYKYIDIWPVESFIDYVNGYNPTDSNVSSFTFNSQGVTFSFNYKDDSQPCRCCVIGNKYVVFDSYDSSLDSTLQSDKTLCGGTFEPTWSMVDSYIPDLPAQQFPLLFNEAKSLAFLEMKQVSHAKAEQESRRQWSRVQKTKQTVDTPDDFGALPDFGRRGSYNTSFFRGMGWRR